jgi:hypothetical protein
MKLDVISFVIGWPAFGNTGFQCWNACFGDQNGMRNRIAGKAKLAQVPQGLCWSAPHRSQQFRVLRRAGALRQHEGVLQPDARVVTASGYQLDERLKRGLKSMQKPLNLHASQMCLDAVVRAGAEGNARISRCGASAPAHAGLD